MSGCLCLFVSAGFGSACICLCLPVLGLFVPASLRSVLLYMCTCFFMNLRRNLYAVCMPCARRLGGHAQPTLLSPHPQDTRLLHFPSLRAAKRVTSLSAMRLLPLEGKSRTIAKLGSNLSHALKLTKPKINQCRTSDETRPQIFLGGC